MIRLGWDAFCPTLHSMPLHPKSLEIAKSGLLAGLKSFADLEIRIGAIPENKNRLGAG